MATQAFLREGLADKRRSAAVMETLERLKRQGWQTASVHSLHAFPLRVALGELGTLECPAASGGSPGVLHIALPRLSMADRGDGVFDPQPVFPAQLAAEFLREFSAIGGVVVTEGGAAPSPIALETATRSRTAWLRRQVALGADSWSRHRQHRFIDDRQREAARELLASGELSQLPEWATAGVQTDTRSCPECAETIKSAARRCRFCGAVLVFEEVKPDAEDAPHRGKRK